MRGSHKGLSKLSPDLLAKAADDTAAQITKILLAFAGTSIFCILSLLTPNSALLASTEKLNVPFAGPVSYYGFLMLGPAILTIMWIFLQIYAEHGRRLDTIIRRAHPQRAPTLIPLRNPIFRLFMIFGFYMLLPLVIIMFAWKSSAFLDWASRTLFLLTITIVMLHLVLPIRRLSWNLKVAVSLGAALVAVVVILNYEDKLHRPLNLERASLNRAYLSGEDLNYANLDTANLTDANLEDAKLERACLINANLTGANLEDANVKHAILISANLTGATLEDAKLTGAVLIGAKLSKTNLDGADLTGANLKGAKLAGAVLGGAKLSKANLDRADLSKADLRGARGLLQSQLNEACGTGAKLDAGLVIKPCKAEKDD